MFKDTKAIIFYVFLIVFIVIAYLYNNNLISFLPKKTSSTLTSDIVEIQFTDKKLTENFSDKWNSYSSEIAGFEESEKWKGEYNIDDTNFMDGKTGYQVISKDNKESVITLAKSINLSDLNLIKFFVFSEKQESIENLKNFTLRLGENETSYFEFSILNLKQGWNLIKMQKENFSEKGAPKWSNIKIISIAVNSRPKTQVEFTLDRLWAEKSEDYQDDFLTANMNMLSLKNIKDKTYIDLSPYGGSLSLIKKISSVKDFTYTAKIIPERKGNFGINARSSISTGKGYFLDFTGIGSGMWQLYKVGKGETGNVTTRLSIGEIANFIIEEGKPIWLRIQTSGSKISGFMSNDGTNFTKVTEKNGSEINSGGVGMQIGPSASILLESIDFSQ
jgi:hypothetical protein